MSVYTDKHKLIEAMQRRELKQEGGGATVIAALAAGVALGIVLLATIKHCEPVHPPAAAIKADTRR